VALIEAVKGVAVLLLMFLIFAVHSQLEDIAENLLYHLHMDPDKRAAQAFLHAASKLSDTRLLTIAAMAVSYSTVRFIESWGLWHRRVWAEWFALLSGGLYLPWEVAKLVEHQTTMHVLILLGNLIVVGYMLYVRIVSVRPAKRDGEETESGEILGARRSRGE
jgi:uncharacterized membrane protein (DUF2068 family)